MPTRITCPRCGTSLSIVALRPGEKTRCLQCGTSFQPENTAAGDWNETLHIAPLPPLSAEQLALAPGPVPAAAASPWQRLVAEGRGVYQATAAQGRRLAHFGSGHWKVRTLDRAADDAQAALGQRLFDLGQGDASLRGQIAEL